MAQKLLTGTSYFISFVNGQGAGAIWAQTVEIGSNRMISNVPVKAVNGRRSYANRGATVLLRRGAQGRYEVIGPGDRVSGAQIKKTYTFGVLAETSTVTIGFTTRAEVFDFYKTGGSPGPSRWNDGATPFPKVTLLDGAGTEVFP